ncbi:MAG: hypothetical protein AMXMBFR80_15920 [Dehalococcoidia bacterium]
MAEHAKEREVGPEAAREHVDGPLQDGIDIAEGTGSHERLPGVARTRKQAGSCIAGPDGLPHECPHGGAPRHTVSRYRQARAPKLTAWYVGLYLGGIREFPKNWSSGGVRGRSAIQP